MRAAQKLRLDIPDPPPIGGQTRGAQKLSSANGAPAKPHEFPDSGGRVGVFRQSFLRLALAIAALKCLDPFCDLNAIPIFHLRNSCLKLDFLLSCVMDLSRVPGSPSEGMPAQQLRRRLVVH